MNLLTFTITIELPDDVAARISNSTPIVAIQPQPQATPPEQPPPEPSPPEQPPPEPPNGNGSEARQLLQTLGFHDPAELLSKFAADRITAVCKYALSRTDLQNPSGYANTVLRRGWRLPRNSQRKETRP